MSRICSICYDLVSKKNVNGYIMYKCFNCNKEGCLECVEICNICNCYVCGVCSIDVCPCIK